MRLGTATAMAVVGIEGRPVRIEAVLLRGLPAVTIVGLPDAAISESRERLRAAFASAGVAFPSCRLTINLSPAGTPKAGAAFDLGIAVAILGAMGGADRYAGSVVMGELGLDGSVRRVRGVLPAALAAAKGDGGGMVVPLGCGEEAGLAGVEVAEVWHLAQVADAMGVPCDPAPDAPDCAEADGDGPETPPDMSDVRGQFEARHAIEVAAAGGHHLLMTGAPGVGKSMLAVRIPGILPPLDVEQAVEVAAIASAAGEFAGRLSTVPPFASPHHTASAAALVGGGPMPKPGAASRAHRGVLFLDEMPEFPTSSLQALREPMETGRIEIHRARAAVAYPARFQLVGAANPTISGGSEGRSSTASTSTSSPAACPAPNWPCPRRGSRARRCVGGWPRRANGRGRGSPGPRGPSTPRWTGRGFVAIRIWTMRPFAGWMRGWRPDASRCGRSTKCSASLGRSPIWPAARRRIETMWTAL